jgi:hypothetical protein
MPLQGQARTDYMREYMRARRAGEKRPEPKDQVSELKARIRELEAQGGRRVGEMDCGENCHAIARRAARHKEPASRASRHAQFHPQPR